MPFHSPSGAQMPPLSILLADTHETPATIARHLGVSRRTLQRYIAADQAPRPVMLALWVESRWGRAAAPLQLRNEAAHYATSFRMAQRQIDALTAQIEAMERERAAGEGIPANSPFFEPGRPARPIGA